MKIKSRQIQKVRPEIAKLIDKLSTKYAKVWEDLAKV